jgi:hypothetical protein
MSSPRTTPATDRNPACVDRADPAAGSFAYGRPERRSDAPIKPIDVTATLESRDEEPWPYEIFNDNSAVKRAVRRARDSSREFRRLFNALNYSGRR